MNYWDFVADVENIAVINNTSLHISFRPHLKDMSWTVHVTIRPPESRAAMFLELVAGRGTSVEEAARDAQEKLPAACVDFGLTHASRCGVKGNGETQHGKEASTRNAEKGGLG